MSSFDTQFDKLFKFYFLIVAVQYPQQTNKFIFNKIRKVTFTRPVKTFNQLSDAVLTHFHEKNFFSLIFIIVLRSQTPSLQLN